MYTLTTSLLYSIFKNNYNNENPLLTFQNSPCRNMFLTYEKNEIIIQQHDQVKYLYFLLKGTAHVINSITWTNSEIIDTLVPLDILGLVELLNNQPTYTAFVIAETPCVVFRVPAEHFLTIIHQNAELCFETLRVLGNVTMHNMDRAETNSIFRAYDRLGHFLYLKASDHIPYIYPYTRKKLADDLHINLRTLYRYIDCMAQEQLLRLERGKIHIDDIHLTKLYEKYGTVTL